MADFNQFAGADEDNVEIKKLGAEVVSSRAAPLLQPLDPHSQA